MFPDRPELGRHMDNVWAALKAVTDDLDKWDPDAQLPATEFKSLVRGFLTLLTDQNSVSPNSSPSTVAPRVPQPVARQDIRNTPPSKESGRKKELTGWTTKQLHARLQQLGNQQHNIIRSKAALVEELINMELPCDEGDEGDESEDSDDNDAQEARRRQLQNMKVAGPDGLRQMARALGVSGGGNKADLIAAVLEKERNIAHLPSFSPAPAPRLGFRVGIITPYMHASGAHLWEQRLHLAKLGKFIGHPLTHKHISCSPGELSNNTYNRTYFQTSNRRLDGLEKTILLSSWRAILNPVDIDRFQYECPYCTHKTVGKTWMVRHITTTHPHDIVLPYVLPVSQ